MSKQQVTLTFADATATITSNDDGMFDLNDIYRNFGLKGRKQPSDWRGKTKEKLFETANLRVEKGGRDKDGKPSTKTLATLDALYAYAMWVDVEFYMVVVQAFTALTRGQTEQAEAIAKQVADVRDALRRDHKHVTDAIEDAV